MGSPERELVTLFRTEAVDPNRRPTLARKLLESRTKVGSETNYFMCFGERSHRALSVHDARDLADEDYPVSETALDSLPAYVRAELEQGEDVQILARYEPTTGEFTDVSLAGEPTPDELIARIAVFLDRGLSLHETVDYLAVKELDHYSVEQWASIRGVGTNAVRSNCRTTEQRIENILYKRH